MTFPVVEAALSSGTHTVTGTTTSMVATVDFPDTVNADDMILCAFVTDSNPTLTKPTGWTEIYNGSHGTAHSRALWALQAAGTEDGGTFDVTLSADESWAANVIRISGWDTAGTLADAIDHALDDAGATSTPDAPSNTVKWDTGLDNLWITLLHLGAGPTCSVYPYADNNITNRVAGGAGAHASMAAYSAAAADTQDPGTFTISSTITPTIVTVAIKPAAAAGGGPAPRLTLLGVG